MLISLRVDALEMKRFQLAFKRMPREYVRAAGAKALRYGAMPALKGVRAAMPPDRSGMLRSKLMVRPGTTKRGNATYEIGFPTPAFVGDTFYAAFVELGHKIGHRSHRESGQTLWEHTQRVFASKVRKGKWVKVRGGGRRWRERDVLVIKDTRRRVPPHPFIKPGFDAVRPAVEAAIIKSLDDSLVKMWEQIGNVA